MNGESTDQTACTCRMISTFALHQKNLLLWKILQMNSDGPDKTPNADDQDLCYSPEKLSDVLNSTGELWSRSDSQSHACRIIRAFAVYIWNFHLW